MVSTVVRRFASRDDGRGNRQIELGSELVKVQRGDVGVGDDVHTAGGKDLEDVRRRLTEQTAADENIRAGRGTAEGELFHKGQRSFMLDVPEDRVVPKIDRMRAEKVSARMDLPGLKNQTSRPTASAMRRMEVMVSWNES